MKRQKRSIIVITLCTMVLCGGGGITAVESRESYPPMQEALDALVSDDTVSVSEVTVASWEEGSQYYYVFRPEAVEPTVGFIFYPGGLVDPRSYAPPLRAIAAEGFLTFIVKMPGDLAPLGSNRANTIIADEAYSGITSWILGGHSVGGVFSCAFATTFADRLDGIVLWASYPSETFRIDDKDLEAILIYGTNNPGVNDDEVEMNKPYLPADTTYVRIEGGNHTQFGWYDTSPSLIQEGDDFADITREEQQAQIIDATVDFLAQFATTTTTTTPDAPCVLLSLYAEDSEEVGLMRHVRDRILTKTASGRELIRLYYALSPAAVHLAREDAAFKQNVKALIAGVLPLMRDAVQEVSPGGE